MREEFNGKVVNDSYICNAGWWTTDYYVETDGKEDLDDVLKRFDGKRVKITIEETE